MKHSSKKRIAIACQGGGSQTAFTAGVLQSFFANKIQNTHDIVALTGTSGGALNAALAWYGMLKNTQGDPTTVEERIKNFWEELKASNPVEQWLDQINTFMIRATGAGHLPKFESSPSSYINQVFQQSLTQLLPRDNFCNFKRLIETHINFSEIPALIHSNSPALFMGAANVLSGKLKIFNSLHDPITAETILASAAIPSIFPAVQIGNDYYWDGLFSANPPISPVLRPIYMENKNFPDEIWIVLIDPLRYKKVPSTPSEILERRTQMTSNISLLHDLEKISIYHFMFKNGGVNEEFVNRRGLSNVANLTFRIIQISDQVQQDLDYSTKLSRNPQLLDTLIADGKQQAETFLKHLATSGMNPIEAFNYISER